MRVAGHWRLRKQRLTLQGEVCPVCGAHIFPPRDVCPECGKPASTPYTFSGRGEVYSFATVYEAPENFTRFRPYTIALIKLEEGPIVTAQLTDVDPDEVEIGMPVEMVTRRLTEEGDEGLILYGYKFRPLMEHQPA
ncbi:MAG: Zn-ribbon domain-containing OB-fold protein [Chloroflexi bacterium]|nr:Zn-ribbon domain-containing OB-fold protein [Chloroflexota bacterium]